MNDTPHGLDLQLRVLARVPASTHAITVTLRPEEGGSSPVYRPGQFLTLRLPIGDDRAVSRSYSLSSSPHVEDELAITVARVSGGVASSWIHESLVPGTLVRARPPVGRFVPENLDASFAMIAAGTGIVPIFSIIKSVLHAGRGRVHLLHLVRDEGSILFAQELAALADEFSARLTVETWFSSRNGRILPGNLRDFLRSAMEGEVFVCGPIGLTTRVRVAARELGIASHRLRSESFLSAAPLDDRVSGRTDGPVAVRARVGARDYEAVFLPGTRLLDGLLNQGVPVPFACRAGICSACRCLISPDAVTSVRDDGLDEDERAAGYRLACQTVILAEPVTIDFDA